MKENGLRSIRLVCIDLDGTLLNKRGEITVESKRGIRRILDQGMAVAIVTGRPYRFAELIRNQIDGRIKIVSFNGNYVDFNGKIIAYSLDQKILERVMEVISGSSTEAFFKSADKVYCYNSDSTMFTYDETVMKTGRYSDIDTLREELKDPLYKILLYNKDPFVLHPQKKEIVKLEDLSLESYGDIGFEILAPHRHKGTAIDEMAAFLGIGRESILSIGDGENDKGMFLSSGYKVAMGNASAEIRDLADFVTDTNDEEGVLKVLRMLES